MNAPKKYMKEEKSLQHIKRMMVVTVMMVGVLIVAMTASPADAANSTDCNVRCNQPSGVRYYRVILFLDSSEIWYTGWVDVCGGQHADGYGYDCSDVVGSCSSCAAAATIAGGWLPPDYSTGSLSSGCDDGSGYVRDPRY